MHLTKLTFCFLIFCQKDIFKNEESSKLFILRGIKAKTYDKSSRCLTLAEST